MNYFISFPCDNHYVAFIKIKRHTPLSLPCLNIRQICLESFTISMRRNWGIKNTIIRKKDDAGRDTCKFLKKFTLYALMIASAATADQIINLATASALRTAMLVMPAWS